MKSRLKPVLALFLLSPILTEVLTGSNPPSAFLNPGLFLMLVTVGYGFPVLVIREIAVRKNFGLLGLFFLGIIYGLYNEGLGSRTIFHPFYSPVDTFATYGLISNIRLPWVLTISVWHALHAVIYPIAFVHYLFPARSSEPWLGKKTIWFLGIITLFFGTLSFIDNNPQGIRGQPVHLIFIFISWIFLWFLAKRFSGAVKISTQASTAFSWKIPRLGIVLYLVLFLAVLIFSKINLPPLLFFLYFIFLAIFIVRRLSKITEIALDKLVLVALGGEIPVALFTILITLPFGMLEQAITGFIFIIIFAAAIFRLRKKFRAVSAIA